MTIKQFIQQHKIIDDHFRNQYPGLSDRERILARLSKISEELGELNNAVLSEFAWQRQEKLDAYEEHELAEEWADVVNTLFSFALATEIDVEKVLQTRLEKVTRRLGIELPSELAPEETGGE